jgi:hypothetical protein
MKPSRARQPITHKRPPVPLAGGRLFYDVPLRSGYHCPIVVAPESKEDA